MLRHTALKSFASALLVAVALTGCDSEEGTRVDERGGTVTSDDGRVTLSIPAGALADEVAIRIVESEALPEDAGGPAYEIQPIGVTFSFPAELAYTVDGNMNEDTHLVVARDDQWNALADHEVDLNNLEVTASVLYTSTIGLVD